MVNTPASFVVRSLLILTLFCLTVAGALGQTPVPVTTWRYDLTHAGQNTSETALTPANVNEASFGKLFSVAVDSTVYPQPLYMPGLTMSDGLVHNVLFVATSNDSIYAFDADSNGGANAKPIWHISLLTAAHGAGAGATAVPWQDTGSPDVAPQIGITGTPTINPATNTMYVVGATKENGVYFSRLHAINILNGAEQANSPVVVTATVAGTGTGSAGGKVTFSPLWQNQRTALNYYNGSVYFGYAAHGDDGPWHGWLFAYNATSLAQTAAVCLSPNGFGAGIWEAGAGLPIDTDVDGGRMFLTTGNGTFSTYPPISASTEFGESIISFNLSNGGLTPTDAFTSFNAEHLNGGDIDQGSGGILMVPDQQGANPHILVQAGKEGRILVINRDHLGGKAPTAGTSNTNILQDIPNQIKGLWSTPAYWGGKVYIWGNGDVPKQFDLDSGVMNTVPSSQSNITSAFPGASFSVSSNGPQDGIAWAVRSDLFNTHGPAVLYAWNANSLTQTIYESDTNAKRDAAGAANKFSVPVVTNGKVYVAANGQVDVYGLFNGQATTASPAISPDGGSFTGSQSVTLSSATASASIYYTLDGSVPTPGSTPYTGPITLSTDTTLNAIASAPGFVQSAVSSATFTFSSQTPAVTFSPAAGTYNSAQQVTLSTTDANAKIYYTINGVGGGTLYTGPITVATSQTINAIAIDPSLLNSNLVNAAYVIQAGGSSINFGAGFSSTAGLDLNGNAVATDDTRLQLTNGLLNEASSVFWNQPIGIQSFTTTFEFQLSLAQANGFTFTIQNIGPKALGGDSAGLGYAGIGKSVAIKFSLYNYEGGGSNSTGVYTDGALPTVPAVDLTPSGIQLSSGDSIIANVTYDGTTLTMNLLDLVTNKTFTLTRVINIPQIVGGNTAYVGFTGGTGGLTSSQKILTWVYNSQTVASTAAPTFSPPAGTYSTPQSVTLASTTPGSLIYYTINNVGGGTLYTGPIPVSTSESIQAVAISPLGTSSIPSAAYVIQASAPTAPTFSPPPGTYSTAQNVTLSSTTPGALIYYTINGIGGGTLYTSPIPVDTSESIQAVAITPEGISTIPSVNYVINAGGATINYAGGFTSSAGLSLLGVASVANSALQLTAGADATAGAAWSSAPININTFTTDFEFQLVNPVADGFTFTIQNDSASAIGPVGSGLGYGGATPGAGGGIGKSVAIKFDVYNNLGEGTDSTGFYTDGASPTLPATDMTSSGVVLRSGHVFHAHITYDGTNLTLLLTDTTTSASFTKTQAINIPSIVGSADAWAGFTGGTGGLSMTTRILNWTWSQ